MSGSDCLDAVIGWSSLLCNLLVLLPLVSTGIWSVCATASYLALKFLTSLVTFVSDC
jgi:hypothetical protein